MRSIYILLSLTLSTFICQAQINPPPAPVKSGAKEIKMLESYTQRTIPGARGMKPTTQYHFMLVWKDVNPPATFFWRGDHNWMSCSILKVHKPDKKKERFTTPKGFAYSLEDITRHPLKKGDTLFITPIPGGKFPIPAEIPQEATNTLYFKSVKSNWFSFPVKKFTTMKDAVMP